MKKKKIMRLLLVRTRTLKEGNVVVGGGVERGREGGREGGKRKN